MKIIIALSICCLLSGQIFSQESPLLGKKQLIVGWGGGITGFYTEYILLEDGQFFKKESQLPDSLFRLIPISKTGAKKYFADLKKLKLAKSKFQKAGNLYYYVQERESAKVQHTVVWGKEDASPPKNVKTFYDTFIKTMVLKK